MPKNTPKTTKPLQLCAPHPAQTQILSSAARFKVVACGRRFGKTELGKLALIEHALKGGVCWWLAPTYRMASEVWRDLARSLAGIAVQIQHTERRIELAGGGVITVRSTHVPSQLRGAGLDFAVLDEAAFMHPSIWAEIVRPMLLERRGGALFLSTPYGHNWFWGLYQLGQDAHQTDWASFRFASSANPAITPTELDAIRAQTPSHIYRAEYLAEFIADGGTVFREVQAAARASLSAQPHPAHEYVMGVDWGRDGDYSALVVLDASVTPVQMVALERFNQVGYHHQRARLRQLAAHWGVARIWAEANSIGTVNIEELQREGLPVYAFTTTARSKPKLIESLALAIERGDLHLLPNETLLAELSAYTVVRLPSGALRYTAPSGMHDDTVIGTALAWYAVTHGGVSIAFA